MQKLTTEQEKLGLKQYVQVFLKAYRKEYKAEKKKFDDKTIKLKIRREWKKLDYEQKLEWVEDCYYTLYGLYENRILRNRITEWCKNIITKNQSSGKTIVSWNVNSLRTNILGKKGSSVDPNSPFGTLLKIEDPDIICLQETKLQEKMEKDFHFKGYHSYFSSSTVVKGYAGVALLTKEKPISVSTDLEGIDEDLRNEGRIITAYFKEFAIVNTYVPNTSRADDDYELYMARRKNWDNAIREHLNKIKEEVGEVIWCGDLNVAMTMRDIYNGEKTKQILDSNRKYPKAKTKEYQDRLKAAENSFKFGGGAGLRLEEREGLQNILDDGFIDAYRELYPLDYGFTYWNMRIPPYREHDNGWRIDYFVTTPSLVKSIKSIEVLRMLGVQKIVPSDHAPLVLKLK